MGLGPGDGEVGRGGPWSAAAGEAQAARRRVNDAGERCGTSRWLTRSTRAPTPVDEEGSSGAAAGNRGNGGGLALDSARASRGEIRRGDLAERGRTGTGRIRGQGGGLGRRTKHSFVLHERKRREQKCRGSRGAAAAGLGGTGGREAWTLPDPGDAEGWGGASTARRPPGAASGSQERGRRETEKVKGKNAGAATGRLTGQGGAPATGIAGGPGRGTGVQLRLALSAGGSVAGRRRSRRQELGV